MSATIRATDNLAYVERRAEQADAAEAQRDRLVAQNIRRYQAINDAVRRLRAVGQHTLDRTVSRPAIDELLEEVARTLEEANQMRATDTEEMGA
ncbi:MAG: hypothetical protein WCF57_20115 [Pyrinomonadaceae bacterium]